MKILNVVGARPQFIKIGPILRAIDEANRQSSEDVEEVLVHTGQHYDREMSEIFFEQLELKKPDYNLGVGSGPQGAQTGEMLKSIEEVLRNEKPDYVIVYGDTNTTLAGSLAAAKLHIPVAHVEAGLRSFNKRMAEEINRILTDHVSSLLFCPTAPAVENLLNEGIVEGVHNVGDVMYDSVLHYTELASSNMQILEGLNLASGGYALATAHRAENTDSEDRLSNILEALDEIAESTEIVMPLHPRTKAKMDELGLTLTHVNVIEPVSYLEMLLLEKNASAIFTDSGGVQKEAYFFGVPCITLRDETEWVETVESGWNNLVGADKEMITNAFERATPGDSSVNFYGDGTAAKRMIKLIMERAHIALPT